MVIEIQKAEYLRFYKLRLTFSDKSSRTVDFGPFIKKNKNPMTRKFLNPSEFQKFQLDYGDLKWGDYEMCFPVWDLYKGKI